MSASFLGNVGSNFIAIYNNDNKVKVGGIKIVDTMRASLCKTIGHLFNRYSVI